MSGPISIQCPKCRAKLKLKNDNAVGKKVPCPKCKKPFVVEAPPEPEDEWDDFGGLDDIDSYGEEYDEAPISPRSRKAGNRKSGSKSSKSKKRRKKTGGPGWVKPVLIGFGALAALSLMVGVGFVGVRMLGGAGANNKINLAYLPPDSELFIAMKMGAAWKAPLMQSVVTSPAGKQRLETIAKATGLKPENIESIIFGASGLSEAGQKVVGQPGIALSPMSLVPDLDSMNGIAVIRTRTAMTSNKLSSDGNPTKAVTYQGETYYTPVNENPNGSHVALYLPNDTTLVAGLEADVKAAIDRGGEQQRRADLDFINEKHHLLFVMVPKDPQNLTGNQNQSLAGLPSQFESVRTKLNGKLRGTCLGVTLSDGVQVEMQGSCLAAADAAMAEKEITTLLNEGKQQLAQTAASLPPSVSGVLNVANSILDKVQVSTDSSTFALKANISKTDIENIKKEAAPLLMAGVMGAMGGGGLPSTDDAATPSEGILPEGSILGHAFDKASAAGAAAQCRNNLKQIGLAFHNYYDKNGHFPAAGSVDKAGKKLLSWRVHLLPFLDQQALYNQFHLNEAWDSPHNKQLLANIPAVYACPSGHLKSGLTTYLGIAGESGILAGSTPRKMSSVTDGLSYTIFVVDVSEARAVPWTKPADYEYVKDKPVEGLVGNHENEFHALHGDGAVHKFPTDYNPQQLAGLYTIGGNDVSFAPLPSQRPRTPAVPKKPMIPKTEAGRVALCKNNLKVIGLAMHNYHDTHAHFVPSHGGWDGKSKLSWRVHLLPYVDQHQLYQQFHLDEPWDSPHNKPLVEKMPAAYACPSGQLRPGMTPYLGVSGERSVFNGTKIIKMRDVTDGSTNTIMVVEVDASRAVIWTKPGDLDYSSTKPKDGLVGNHSKGFHALFCDGRVEMLPAAIEEKTLKALFTMSGGETVRLR